jgi:dipeptidase D
MDFISDNGPSEGFSLLESIVKYDRVENTENLRNFIVSQARKCGYNAVVDSCNNVVCTYPSSHKLLILAHYDISTHVGYTKSPSLQVLDGVLSASKGYLGASSISVAGLLYLMSLQLPIQAIFTANKFHKMQGVKGLVIPPYIRYVLDLNYHKERAVIYGSPGSVLLYANLPVEKVLEEEVETHLVVSIDDMHTEGNENMNIVNIAFDSLSNLDKIVLCEINSSKSENFKPNKLKLIYASLKSANINTKYFKEINLAKKDSYIISNTKNIVNFINGNRDKIFEYNTVLAVAYSSLSMVYTGIKDNIFTTILNIRYTTTMQKENISQMIASLAQKNKFQLAQEILLEPWLPKDSSFVKLITREMDKYYSNIKATLYHGDMECAVLANKYENLSICSIGVQIHNEYTLSEYMEVKDINQCMSVCINVIKRVSM